MDDPDRYTETIDKDTAYTIIEQVAAAKDVEDALAKLRPEYKTVFLLYYKDDLQYETIARVLNIPINTVKTYLYRAKKSLKNILEGPNNENSKIT